MATAPEISVIMPMFNSSAYVAAAVKSILRQTFREFELLVVDDGSTDGCTEIVSGFDDCRIRLIALGKLGGPAAARNVGLANATGRYIAFFDSDDVAAPEMLAELHGFLQTHPQFRFTAGWVETIDAQGNRLSQGAGYADKPGKLAATMLFWNCLPTSSLLMERCCLENRKFDPTLALASDYEMWTRVVVEHEGAILPRVLAQYRWYPQNITHQKKTFEKECLDQIFRRQLARLGVEPTEQELALHRGLRKLTFGTPKALVEEAERWLLKLDEANVRTQFYPQAPFREVLADHWYGVCHSAGCNGLWNWRKFVGARLAKWASFTPRQYYTVLRLSVRGALKNLRTCQ